MTNMLFAPTTLKRFSLLMALVCLPSLAGDKNQLPQLQTKVAPDWGSLSSNYVIDVVEVELTMLPSGEPFFLDSVVTLPDPVVRALSQWRFSKYRKDGADVPFSMIVKVPVRRPVNDDYQTLQVPQFQLSNELYGAVHMGQELSSEKALQLLAKLSKAESESHPRISLLAHYSSEGASADPVAARKIRRELIAWFLANDPENGILSSCFATINPSGEPLADAEAIPDLTEQWRSVVQQNPRARAITDSAVHFLRVANPPVAFQVISGLPTSSKRSNLLGHVRAITGMGVTAISPSRGTVVAVASNKLPDNALAISSRQALLASSDVNELISALLTTTGIAQDLVNQQVAIPDGYDEFCQSLLSHTRELFPQIHADCKRPQPIRGGGAVLAAQLIRRVQPRYPAEARQRRIQGKVIFKAIIGKDGIPRDLELLRAPFALYEEAHAAVLQWRWEPTLLNGAAIAIHTDILVNFVLQTR